MATGQKTIGTTLQKTSNTPLTVAGLTKIGAFGVSSEDIDTTSLDSPNNFKEFVAGLLDGGEVPIEGVVKDTTTVSTMIGLALSQSIESWIVTTPLGQKWFVQAYVKQFMENDRTTNGVRGYKGSLRITGKPVFAENGISS